MKDNNVSGLGQAQRTDAVGTGRPVDLHAPAEVIWVAEQLEKAGFSAWAVGGAVRDALAGGTPTDWDLTTSATPRQVQRIFPRTVPIGIDHGTVGVLGRSGHMYEVTTFRRDVETFGRKARVAFSDRLEEDLERRDFTINAVAWHPITHEVRDPHHGLDDLKNGLLRTVGDASARFREDRLRVLRALRFAGRFNLRIEEATERALSASATELGDLSPERVREELMKVLSGQRSASKSLGLYAESGVLKSLYPELERVRSGSSGEGSWAMTLRAVDAVPPTRFLVRMAALFHRTGGVIGTDQENEGAAAAAAAGTARNTLQRLRSSNAEVDKVVHLLAQLEPVPTGDSLDAEVRRWVRRVGREHISDMLRLLFALCRAGGTKQSAPELLRLAARARSILRAGVPLTVQELPVGGNDLRSLGIPPGPRYGELLRSLLERVTDDPQLNDRQTLLDLVADEL